MALLCAPRFASPHEGIGGLRYAIVGGRSLDFSVDLAIVDDAAILARVEIEAGDRANKETARPRMKFDFVAYRRIIRFEIGAHFATHIAVADIQALAALEGHNGPRGAGREVSSDAVEVR